MKKGLIQRAGGRFENFGEIYFSEINPKTIKAWKLHKNITQNITVLMGKIRLVLYDNRPSSKTLGKIPVEVNDYPGFVANRILMPMLNESIETLYNGVAGVFEIDTVMKLGMAHPMGPLQLADFIGLDVCLSILNVMYEGFKNPKYAPCPLLVNMVRAGKLGIKSGEGFYDYSESRKAEKIAKQFQ